jgi:outer membrane protein OmpA-like peptidoglycan-associated protein
MLKKLLKLSVVAGLMAVVTTAISAQNEYPRYGFWSNWSIGVMADFDKQANHRGFKLGEGTSIGGAIFVEKKLNHVWDVRFRGMMPGLISSTKMDPFYIFGTATVGFKFSVNNALMGYNPESCGNFYLFADAGGALWMNNSVDGRHRLNVVADAGLGYAYKVSNHSTIFAEAGMICMAHVPNIFKNRHQGLDAYLALGYAFNFGLTAEDEELNAQRAALSQENLDALNEQIANLERQVNNGKQNEKRLEGRIAELESQVGNTPVNGGNDQAAKELQAKIDQIKADQLTFYALPFSILYGVDQYTVSASEQQKLKAIARVMKDNPNTKYMVYGFTDYTGSDDYNMKLSEKRAKEVVRQLVEKYGIAESRLEAKWNGKNAPFGDVKYSVNRRVSIYRVIE